MPRITTHAIPLEIIRRASATMIDELAVLLNAPREHFSIEVRQDPFVFDGEVAPGDPFVEVSLFDRGPELEGQLAQLITSHLQTAGCPHLDLHLIKLERARYYEDGVPF